MQLWHCGSIHGLQWVPKKIYIHFSLASRRSNVQHNELWKTVWIKPNIDYCEQGEWRPTGLIYVGKSHKQTTLPALHARQRNTGEVCSRQGRTPPTPSGASQVKPNASWRATVCDGEEYELQTKHTPSSVLLNTTTLNKKKNTLPKWKRIFQKRSSQTPFLKLKKKKSQEYRQTAGLQGGGPAFSCPQRLWEDKFARYTPHFSVRQVHHAPRQSPWILSAKSHFQIG